MSARIASTLRYSLARPTVGLNAFRASIAPATVAVRHLGIPPLIAQPPGGIVGTVNDAVKVPPPDKVHGSYHWTFERLISIGLVPLVIAPFTTGTALSPVLDAVFSTATLLHCYIGFQSCIIDYIPKREFGKVHDFCMWLLLGGSVVTGYGFYKLETEDVGLTGTIIKAWTA
ncbi:CybS-domain-containing protein [Lipomyces arxii]|uniref:CybS-domain-containing protein n=1 Tax=Lipomyces arxii TaxID=56418 RepID=UPI0034CD9EA6